MAWWPSWPGEPGSPGVSLPPAGWPSFLRLVLEDHVCSLAVGHHLDDAVARVAPEIGADLQVKGGGVGEVQRDVGEVALGDVLRERSGVARADNTGVL